MAAVYIMYLCCEIICSESFCTCASKVYYYYSVLSYLLIKDFNFKIIMCQVITFFMRGIKIKSM